MTTNEVTLKAFGPDLADWLKGIDVLKTIASGDTMFNPVTPDAYFNVGRSGLRLVLSAVAARLDYFEGDSPITEILDFGAGYGRVTRFLRAGFPDASITVTDMDEAGPLWCAKNLNVKHLPSQEPLPQRRYDIIFLGSVFTHLRHPIVSSIILKLFDALTPNGILIFTTHGRYARTNLEENPTTSYRLSRESVEALIKEYDQTGYGYQDYAPGREYGISLINPTWMLSHLAPNRRLVLALFQEKGFDNHQDVFAFVRTHLGQKLKSKPQLQSLAIRETATPTPTWHFVNNERFGNHNEDGLANTFCKSIRR